MRSLIKKVTLFAAVFNIFFTLSTSAQYGGMAHNANRMANNYRNAKENGKNVKSYLSYSLGVGIPFTSGTFQHSFQDQTAAGTIIGERSIVRKIAGTGIHMNANIYYPLAELSENSILAFNFGVAGYVLKYNIGEVRINENHLYDYSMNSMQIGLPLCLDYKYGGEAVYNKSQKTSFTLGIGLAPILYANTFGDIQKLKGGIRPFLRAEMGFFAGIEWRVTGSCLAGTANTMNLVSGNSGMESMPASSKITLNSKPIFSVGIAFMPFSYDWEQFGWW